MSKTKVINLYGGPGSGKSTTAAGLFFLMKTAGYTCELIHEWIKDKVYEGNNYVTTDQTYVFAKQQKLLRQAANHVPIIVTDSPLLLSFVYGADDDLKPLVMSSHNQYENINIFLNRTKPYNPVGRYQDENGAKELDRIIQGTLHDLGVPFWIFDGNEVAPQRILEALKDISIDSPEEELKAWNLR